MAKPTRETARELQEQLLVYLDAYVGNPAARAEAKSLTARLVEQVRIEERLPLQH